MIREATIKDYYLLSKISIECWQYTYNKKSSKYQLRYLELFCNGAGKRT